ncbi:MAG: DUF4097 domain-containing protein [Lachnospiraceae bacterium]|nr:DUF4097 domain-containing protein [Lachnospiraceae bacterium]
MKRFNFLIIVISLVFIILGAGLLSWGLRSGAKPVVRVGDKNASGSNDYVSGEIEITEFDDLLVDATSMDVTIEEGDSYSLTYYCLPDNIPVVEQNGKKLSVRQNTKNGIVLLSFSFDFNSDNEYYKITVPKNAGSITGDLKLTSGALKLSDIELDGSAKITSGDYNMNNVKGKELKLTATSGGYLISDCEYDDMQIKVTSGDVKCENVTFKKLDLNVTSGDMKFDNISTDDVFVDMTSGSVKMDIRGREEDYDYSVKVTSGDITIGGNEVTGKYSTDKGRAKKIEAKATSGDLNITFME